MKKILIIVIGVLLFSSCLDSKPLLLMLEKYEAIDSVLIAQEIIIKQDTFDIINMNSFSSEVTLSNSITYSTEYIYIQLNDELKMKVDSIINTYDKKIKK